MCVLRPIKRSMEKSRILGICLLFLLINLFACQRQEDKQIRTWKSRIQNYNKSEVAAQDNCLQILEVDSSLYDCYYTLYASDSKGEEFMVFIDDDCNFPIQQALAEGYFCDSLVVLFDRKERLDNGPCKSLIRIPPQPRIDQEPGRTIYVPNSCREPRRKYTYKDYQEYKKNQEFD